jgi:predicted helicase
MIRPFTKKFLYFDKSLVRFPYGNKKYFPSETSENIVINLNSNSLRPFGVLATNVLSDFHLLGDTQCFPLYIYDLNEKQNDLDLFSNMQDDVNNITRRHSISDKSLEKYVKHFGNVTKEDIFHYVYGILHSKDYRSKFQLELQKILPRIPLVENFTEFKDIGKKLIDLHVNYESLDQYPLHGIPKELIELKKIRYGKHGGQVDKGTLIINDVIEVKDIPLEAHEFRLLDKSALDWVVEKYQYEVDAKTQIEQDPLQYSGSGYVLSLIGKIVSLSLDSVSLVDQLPRLKIIN